MYNNNQVHPHTPESHLDGKHLYEIIRGEHVSVIRVIREVQPHDSRYLGDHLVLTPTAIILIKVNPVLFQTCVELWPHNSRLQHCSMDWVHKVSVFCHHEPNECDALFVLIEKDIRVGAEGVYRGK